MRHLNMLIVRRCQVRTAVPRMRLTVTPEQSGIRDGLAAMTRSPMRYNWTWEVYQMLAV